MQVYVRPKKKLLGSSLAFNLKEGPVRCAKVCDRSWVILILLLSEDFGGARIGNFDIKPTDGATIFAFLRTRETSGIEFNLSICPMFSLNF